MRTSDTAQTEVLDLDVFLDTVLGAFTAQARGLHAAKGRHFIGNQAGIDTDHAVLQRLGHTENTAQVTGVEVGRQTKLGIVGLTYHIGLIAEAEQRRQRAEGFFAGNRHAAVHASENGRLKEETAQFVRLATGNHGRALVGGVLQVTLHFLDSARIDQRSGGHACLGAVADLQLGNSVGELGGEGVVNRILHVNAVEGAMISKYRNAGQTCVCANRIYVQDSVYDAFSAKLADAVAKLKVGDGTEAGVTTGPLIDARAVEKVQRHLKDATDKGAKVIAGGKPHELGGFFFEPTILTGVDSSMAVAREETFGPLAPLFRFSDESDVIRQANDTEFGLAAYFYARDLSRVFRVAEALEYGMVGINTGLISNEVAPFGGMKSSGLGREGSKYGIEEYIEIKYLCLGGI